MTEKNKTILIACLQRQREAMNDELPIYDSLIGYSLFLVLCQYEIRGETPRLKDIHLEVRRSQGAVHRLITSLSADGWITIAKSDGDQRSRYAVATPKLKQAIAKFTQSIHGSC